MILNQTLALGKFQILGHHLSHLAERGIRIAKQKDSRNTWKEIVRFFFELPSTQTLRRICVSMEGTVKPIQAEAVNDEPCIL